ncbi:LytTR family DNA-binding domain-containing protein [Aquimarina sp. 2201CG5-10]|uniref:LytR/AlgR family response regulator transcription factor n=1 Tax=Aquimarina callyspongiae TaxID=3098150 RepID=UPI002AB481FC|nr:LytTR family DNA-binding domain-containing protein [Aquimarina sp. 2201CG5-10]MDY8135062.1 LytTR family DNA-binding domain-containing protein [Aquimarina sp. 2201CG5-10]
MKTRCLLVDDEPLAIRLLENHISKIDSFDIVATCNNAIQALEVLKTKEVDLLFLDIKMPNITGLDFLKTIKNPPKTIITTAYREYALEGYDLDILDYLLKPITFERFFRAVERFLRNSKTVTSDLSFPVEKLENYIRVKSGNKYHKVNTDDIIYIESLKDYIKVHTLTKQIQTKFKISDIEKELNSVQFLRVHRSYIVNLQKITAYTQSDIELSAIEIPIGVSYKEKVYSYLEIKK